MQKIVLISVVLLFSSCKYFDNQVPQKEDLLQKELQSINWKHVDEFPSIDQCDSISDKDGRRQCFIDYLIENIQQRISVDTLALRYPEIDTIKVKITVFPDSTVTFDPDSSKQSHEPHIIDSIIRARLREFPKVNPALKRGIPVTTQFIVPVILNIE